MDLLSKQEHVQNLYLEAAKIVNHYTPQLFTFKDVEAHLIQAHGSGVLLTHKGDHYLVSAFHCLQIQDGVRTQVGVLNAKGQLRLISGPMAFVKGINDEIDLALIKLYPESVKVLSETYEFLEMNKMIQAIPLPDNTDYLVFGHPISKTIIDNRHRKISLAPLIHIGKSAEAEVYKNLSFKKKNSREKFQFDRNKNTLIGFDKRKSTVIGSGEMSMSPDPTGISGCGIWYIPTYDISDPTNVDICLAGIIIECDFVKRYLIGTKTETIAYLFENLLAMANKLD